MRTSSILHNILHVKRCDLRSLNPPVFPSDSADLMEPPGLNRQLVRPAAEWNIKVELEEQEGGSFKEEADDKDGSWALTETEVMNEASPPEADGTLIVIQEDGGYSDRVMWLIQGYQLSDAKSQNGRSVSVGAQDEKASELNDEGTFSTKFKVVTGFNWDFPTIETGSDKNFWVSNLDTLSGTD